VSGQARLYQLAHFISFLALARRFVTPVTNDPFGLGQGPFGGAKRRQAIRSQLPMMVFMVGLTSFSLWILAQPIIQ